MAAPDFSFQPFTQGFEYMTEKINQLIPQVRAFKGWYSLSDTEVIEQALLCLLKSSSVYQGDMVALEADIWGDGLHSVGR